VSVTMRAKTLTGTMLIGAAVIAPFLLAAFGVTLGQITTFNASIGDGMSITEYRFDPNWPVVALLGSMLFAGGVLLILPARRRSQE
jgi:hypothetical protein